MRKVLVLVLTVLSLAAATFAQDQPVTFDAKRARIYQSAPGRALTQPSTATPVAVVAQFLRERGVSASTVASLRAVALYRSPVTGLVHVRFEQQVAGLRVANAYVRAAVNQRGELVHLIQNIALPKGTAVAAARVNEQQALRATLAKLHPALRRDPAAAGRQGNVTTYVKSTFFHTPPTVERMAVLMQSGALKTGFLVETWSERGNLLHETLVDGGGRVVDVELRTNTDSYNIFPDHPDNSTQTIVAGPGAGNAQSPDGWLFAGDHSSVDIAGNNAHAYLDTDANNAPDAGGTTVSDGNFLTAANDTVSPATSDNQNVAVQNLFYLNNVLHDMLYQHGFVEGTGNFQEDNFGNGGRGGDSVNAEAQDGAGTDNANFATPHEGRNPRMQMFLWTGKGDHQVIVNAVTYRAQGAVFGGTLDATGITNDIALVNDGTGTTSDACQAIPNAGVSGKIALIDRGTCTFVVKVKNAQNAGAVGAIVANHLGDSIFTMGGTDATITIPPVFIGKSDGDAIKALLPTTGTMRLTDPAPLMRDGDVDSDIVYHEYGHGLTWRMIGRMSGAMSGAIGEGMSDTLSVIFNENDVVGEYSFDDSIGIRTAPYTGYSRTYGDIAGTGVHFDGEVYGAIGWRLFEIFGANSISKDTLLGYMVDGMNFTPAAPSFEDMRDGILQSVANSPTPEHECFVWQAFADYGVGVGAKGVTRGPSVVVTETFAVPAECSP
ncbi:MAG: M36 family metallopeptidase [Terriglobales bacterium]